MSISTKTETDHQKLISLIVKSVGIVLKNNWIMVTTKRYIYPQKGALMDSYEEAITEFSQLSEEQQRKYYTRLYQKDCSEMPLGLLKRLVAYKLQAIMYGDLTPSEEDELTTLIHNKSELLTLSNVLFYRRIYKGRCYTVEQLPNNTFLYNGTTYRSLSAIAAEITGRPTNGVAFFTRKQNAALITQ